MTNEEKKVVTFDDLKETVQRTSLKVDGLGYIDEISVNGNVLDKAGRTVDIAIPSVAQSDWNEADETSPAYIKNKPDITGGSSGAIPTQEKTIEINISGKVSENQAYGSIVKLKPAEHAAALEYAKANGSISAASVTIGGSISDIVFNSVELRKFETSDNVYVTPAGDNVAIFKVDPEGMVHGYALYKYGYEKGDNIRIKLTLTHPKIGSCYLEDNIVRKKELEDVYSKINELTARLDNIPNVTFATSEEVDAMIQSILGSGASE